MFINIVNIVTIVTIVIVIIIIIVIVTIVIIIIVIDVDITIVSRQGGESCIVGNHRHVLQLTSTVEQAEEPGAGPAAAAPA